MYITTVPSVLIDKPKGKFTGKVFHLGFNSSFSAADSCSSHVNLQCKKNIASAFQLQEYET